MLPHHQTQILIRSHPMMSMKETGRGNFVLFSIIIVIDWREIFIFFSFLEEIRSAAALSSKQIRRSHLPIVCLVPIVSELAKSIF